MKFYLPSIVLSVLLIISCSKETESQTTTDENQPIEKMEIIPVEDISLVEINKWHNAEDDTIRVINYWATWCGPCKQEIPLFVKMQQELVPQKVKVYFISLDNYSSKGSVEKMVNKSNMNNSYIVSNETRDSLAGYYPNFNAIPYTLFIKNKQVDSQIGTVPSVEKFMEKISPFLSE